MASTKEAIVIILDIGSNSAKISDNVKETFLDKEKECCLKLVQKKIFEAKKDEVALIFMGTEETQNQKNSDSDGYENICEVSNLNIPNWNLVRIINRCESSDVAGTSWLDAIDVGIEHLVNELKNKKFGNLKIVLFTSFNSIGESCANKDDVVQRLKDLGIELVVISDNIEFAFDTSDSTVEGPTQGVFTDNASKPFGQIEAETLIRGIIEETDGNLTNFECVIDHLTNFQRRKTRPTYWYGNLEIGKDLHMQVASCISIKRETHFKFEIAPKKENNFLRRETDHYRNGEKVDLIKEDMIKGYMIGSTPIAYDKTLGAKESNTTKGLRCLAFTRSSLVPPQILCGSGTRLVMAKEGDGRSQKLFRLLVKAMLERDYFMIGMFIYRNGLDPKMVVMTPNVTTSVPALNTYELAFADQIHHWYFPKITTKSTQPTPEQYQAVDELIEAMDLMDVGEGGREAFPHEKLVSPVVQNIYETVTKRILDPQYKVEVFDHRLEQALKVPDIVLQRAAEPIQKVKDLFKLELPKAFKKELVRKLVQIPAESGEGMPTLPANHPQEDVKKVLEVGTVTPEEDFKTLLNEDLSAFPRVSEQMGNVLYDLIFRSMTDQSEKVCDAMTTFREFAKFYGPYLYSDWIRSIKTTALQRKKLEFWEDIVVRNKLGVISTKESEKVASVTQEEAEEFYRVNVVTATANEEEGDEADVDDLFGQM